MTITNHTDLFPTVSGKTFGVVMSGAPWAVQCTRCLRICKSASVIDAAGFAIFVPEHMRGPLFHRPIASYVWCTDCRKACGCDGCKEALR